MGKPYPSGRQGFSRVPGLIIVCFLFLSLRVVITGSQPHISFAEIAQSSDLIFVGTVEMRESRFNARRNFIITEVLFRDIQVIHGNDTSVQREASTILLEHGGGCADGLCLDVSIAPSFREGRRYLLFVNDDGGTYANPLIGGSRGQYQVVEDLGNGVEYVLTAGGRAVYRDQNGLLTHGSQKVIRFRDGNPEFPALRPLTIIGSTPPPIPHDPADGAAATTLRTTTALHDDAPLTLADFIQYIQEEGLRAPLTRTLLRRGQSPADTGSGLQHEDTQIPPEWMEQPDPESPQDGAATSLPQGGTLGYCGYHTLPFIMETVPAGWWSYDTFEAARQTWNWFMDIYQKRACDNKYGHNLTNEVCGWVPEAQMQSIYGVGWNGYLGWAHHWWKAGSPCGRLLESDIMFNPGYDWTSNPENAWGNDDLILLRPVAMHEMAHTWGMQRGSEGQWGYYESYDYDYLTVVHSYYHDIIEDGRGIHVSDAMALRMDYQARTGIKDTVDVGVESYYADDGLHNATPDKSTYYPGDAITLRGITVENNSYKLVANVRLRVFLSTDRTITADDYQVGSNWNWDTFQKESRSVCDLESTIPAGIPAGTYYIGLIITVNGLKNDDYTLNNRTSFASTIRIMIRSSGGGNGGEGGGGCFVATAAHGSDLHPHVGILKTFRDTMLLNHESGRRWVSAYYHYSPHLARLISGNPVLKTVVRTGLLPAIVFSRAMLALKAAF